MKAFSTVLIPMFILDWSLWRISNGNGEIYDTEGFETILDRFSKEVLPQITPFSGDHELDK